MIDNVRQIDLTNESEPKMLTSSYAKTNKERQALELAQEKMNEALAGYIEDITEESLKQFFDLINYLQENNIDLETAKTSFIILLKDYARTTADAQKKATCQII